MEIILTRGKKTIIDDKDWILLSGRSWSCSNGGYAVAKINNKICFMHRIIMGNPKLSVDHINGDKLDNRKENLRIVTHAENTKNRTKSVGTVSKFKGVDYQKRNKTWRARIKVNYRSIYLGSFLTENEAATAYNQAALTNFGSFAKLNIIKEVAND